jgi:TfoX/Sxy family transcriptional regulator of competence genes
MATSEEYIEYVCDQMKKWNPKYKKMFGEYMVYINEKPLFTVCDDTVFVKELDCIKDIMENAEKGFPYEGAKECYIVDIDNKELVERIIPEIEQVISVPVKKSKNKK